MAILFLLLIIAHQVAGQLSVSGLSAGGFMAVQYQVAFSSQIDGAGIFAGGPYYCSQGQITNALIGCMTQPSSINVNTLISYANTQASKMTIDNPNNLNNQKTYLFSGTLDSVVVPGVMVALNKFYQNYVTNSSNLVTNFGMAAQHAMITDSYGKACNYLGAPFINNCNFDAAGAVLKFIYGSLNTPTTAPTSNVKSLSTSSYVPFGWTASSMSFASTQYYYLPSSGCTSSVPCKLHIVFHGCKQTTADIGMDYVYNTGYNEWAESNNIIVLYPQAVKSYWAPSNPNGCFDWWGYTNSNFALQSGPQMATVSSMVDYLRSTYTVAYNTTSVENPISIN